jgi:hypothetical protein
MKKQNEIKQMLRKAKASVIDSPAESYKLLITAIKQTNNISERIERAKIYFSKGALNES